MLHHDLSAQVTLPGYPSRPPPSRWNIALIFAPRPLCHAMPMLTQVLFEADIDDDRKLSASEFSHVITKSPDFITTFHFRI